MYQGARTGVFFRGEGGIGKGGRAGKTCRLQGGAQGRLVRVKPEDPPGEKPGQGSGKTPFLGMGQGGEKTPVRIVL
jgi:hypothetical protein